MKFKKTSKMLITVCAIGVLAFSSIPAFASTADKVPDKQGYTSSYATGDNNITPYDMDVASGSLTNATQFKESYSLKSANGKNVNFWIKNNGTVNVKITINGKGARTFAPGEQGHITASVGIISRSYEFKAVPTPNGGKISIDYSIAQRD